MSLREKAVSGMVWNSVEVFAIMAIEFIFGVILARLLSPYEFGLIGMVSIFIAISGIFINSGLSQALIQKKVCTQEDYSTAFFYNFTLSVLCFIILYLCAPLISHFFEEPKLLWIIRCLATGLVIGSVTIIQRTTLIKDINFKLLSKLNILSSLISGIVSIGFAFYGFGVWSLIIKTVLKDGIMALLLFIYNKWIPALQFSVSTFKILFRFGSKLLASGLIGIMYSNFFNVMIGKIYSPIEVGYYTRADIFKNLASKNIETVITSVSFPFLSQIQDDKEKLSRIFRLMIRNLSYVLFLSMSCLAAVSHSMILLLLGEKWSASIPLLQLLCFVGMIQPLISVHVSIFNVVGRPELYLKFQVLFLTLFIPVFFLGVFFNLAAMIIGIIIVSIINLVIVSIISQKHTGYTFLTQTKDLFPLLIFGSLIGLIVYCVGRIFPESFIMQLVSQFIVGCIAIVSLSELLRIKEYLYLKDTFLLKLKSFYAGN